MATLDPAAQPFVDDLNANFPPIGTGITGTEPADAQKVRRLLAENAPPAPEPTPVGAVTDRTIPGPAGEIPVRIYQPASGGTPPIVVYFHGGGWTICDLDTHDENCRRMTAGAGVVTMSVDYRRAPEHRYPAAADDAYAATVWAAEHAGELGGDASRLVVAGDSAGGNLTAAVTLMARDRGGPRLDCQVLLFPATSSMRDAEFPSYEENAEGYMLTKAGMEWFWDHYLSSPEQAANPYASPLHATDLGGLPPAIVATAEYDPLRDEGLAYAERLAGAGAEVVSLPYAGMIHDFFLLGFAVDRTRRLLADVGEHLGNRFGLAG